MQRLRELLMLMWVGMIATTIGCGGASSTPTVADFDTMAKAKVEAFKKLADAMAKDPNGFEARVALEEIYSTPLQPSKNRKEAEEIVALYHAKIKGKYQGEVAQSVQSEVTGIENLLKQAN